MEAERILDETMTRLSGQRHGVVRSVEIEDFTCRVADKKRQLVFEPPAVMAPFDIDMRAGVFIDIDQVEEELQHTPVVQVEMVFVQRCQAPVRFARLRRKTPPDARGDQLGLRAEILPCDS